MSGIKVVNHVISVQQMPTERALYLAKKQWVEGKDNADAELLPFCSHFAPQELGTGGTGGSRVTASAAVERMLEQQKKERAVQQERVNDVMDRIAKSKSFDPKA